MKTTTIRILAAMAATFAISALSPALRINGPGNGFDTFRESVNFGAFVYSVGTSYASPGRGTDILVTCHTLAGGLAWAQLLDGPASANDEGVAIAVTAGGVYVTGTTPGAGGNLNVYVGQLNPATGAILNQAQFGSPAGLDDVPSDVVVTPTPSVVVVGKAANPVNTDVLLLAYTPALGLAAANFFDAGNDDYATAVDTDPAGMVYITGGMENGAGVSDMLLQRWTPGLTIDWAAALTYKPWSQDYGTDIQVTPAGVYALGSSNRGITGWDFMMVRAALGGGIGVRRFFGSLADDFGIDLEVWAGGQVYAAGNTGNDIMLVRGSPLLALIGSSTFGSAGGGTDKCSAMALDAGTGDAYLYGTATSAATGDDSLLVSFDAFGALRWNTAYDFAGLADRGSDVLFAAGGVFAVGTSEGVNADALFNRYDPGTGVVLF